jgi:carbamoyltransferase
MPSVREDAQAINLPLLLCRGRARSARARSSAIRARPRCQNLLDLEYRESFRPFAPAVLRESAAEWFAFDGESPYMLFVAGVRPERRRAMTAQKQALFGINKLNVMRSQVPAVTRAYYSTRLQTVGAETNPCFRARRFNQVNTSFNMCSEPIMCMPEDAFHGFVGTEIGNCAPRKKDQNLSLARGYGDEFEPSYESAMGGCALATKDRSLFMSPA